MLTRGAAVLSVVVSTATGLVTNLVTARWTVALVVALAVLMVAGAAIQVYLVSGGRRSDVDDQVGRRGIRQRARATGSATVVQAGRDAHVARDA